MISPIFQCKKCYFLTHSRFSFGNGADVTFSNCTWQCSGCGHGMNVSHMSFHGDDMFVIGDSKSFKLLIAHLLEVGSVRVDGRAIYIDETRIPAAFAWAKAIARRYPKDAIVLLSGLASLGLAITTVVDGRAQHRESMRQASELARLQMEQANQLANASESGSKDYRRLATRVCDLLERIQSESLKSDEALRQLIDEHNRAMVEIHRLLRDAEDNVPAVQQLEAKPVPSQKRQEAESPLSDLVRRSGTTFGNPR